MDEEEAEVTAGGSTPVNVTVDLQRPLVEAATATADLQYPFVEGAPTKTAPSATVLTQADPAQALVENGPSSTNRVGGNTPPRDTLPSRKTTTTGQGETNGVEQMEFTPQDTSKPLGQTLQGEGVGAEDSQGTPDQRLKWKPTGQWKQRFDPKQRIPEPRRRKDSQ
ncbi:hypothetical protein HPB47_008171 [Ixodes persulcatus]|uniref:Uncharacterized protein n=1 Tax=Ixodes persulcatus TaxID=34615 RepID=A0AC60P5H0_IXOPE|nr:hypothetical protein HPB47_008171 [Ixodes persulcatus]